MSAHWMLNTHGDPLGRTQQFLADLWAAARLDLLLVPPAGHEQPIVLETPAGLEKVNPFQPVMLVNAAKLIPQALAKRENARLGAVLRPCELRALRAMLARGGLDTSRLLTVSVDCLGTFPQEEYEWRSAHKDITAETLQFAPQGGIAAYRYRPACQMCLSPAAVEADVNIGLFGLPARQTLLLEAKTEEADWRFLADGPAAAALAEQRAKAIAMIHERHARRRERLLSDLDKSLPDSLETLIEQFDACASCRACMDNCPICSIHYPRRDSSGRFAKDEIANWLASCVGCGMCEQFCPQHLPLGAIFAQVKAGLAE